MYMIEAYKLRPKMERPNGDHKLDNQGWVGRPAAAVSIEEVSDRRHMRHICHTTLRTGG